MSRSLYLIEGPDSTSYVTLYVILLGPNGLPLKDITGYVKIINLPLISGNLAYGNTEDDMGLKAWSNASGLMKWDIVQGARVKITVPYIDYEEYKTIPATGLIALGDL
jgi:hypothetical protein